MLTIGFMIRRNDKSFHPEQKNPTSVGEMVYCILWYHGGLTVWTLLSTSLQQQLGDGYVVGHDGNVEWCQAPTVGCVQVQVLG